MTKRLEDEIKARYDLVCRMEQQAEQKLMSFPEGRIKIKQSGNRLYYFHIGEKDITKEKRLNENDKKLIEDLIQKSYIKKVLASLKIEKEFLEKTIGKYPETVAEDVYEHISDNRRQIIKPIVLTDEQYIQRWMNTPFSPKPITSEQPVFITLKGEHVRSKSEMIIADRLLANGIPYKYECPLKIKNGVIHPDFTILKVSERRILYLEHCGKMDDPKYTESSVVKRVNDYSLAGVSLGDNLFLTFESSSTPLDVRVLDDLINKNFK